MNCSQHWYYVRRAKLNMAMIIGFLPCEGGWCQPCVSVTSMTNIVIQTFPESFWGQKVLNQNTTFWDIGTLIVPEFLGDALVFLLNHWNKCKIWISWLGFSSAGRALSSEEVWGILSWRAVEHNCSKTCWDHKIIDLGVTYRVI